jgi:hypothetical protein
MDPTSDGLDMGNLRPDDHGATSLVLDPDSGKWRFVEIPYQTPELQLTRITSRVHVKSPTEAVADEAMSVRGSTAMALRQVLRTKGLAQKVFEQLSALLYSGSTLRGSSAENEEDIWHPLGLKLDIDVAGTIRPEDDHFRLAMPDNFPLEKVASLKQRATPVWLGPKDSYASDTETELPSGYRTIHTPADFAFEFPWFSAKRTAKASGGKVTVHFEYKRNATEVPIAEYANFREAVQRVERAFHDELVFGTQSEKPAKKRK